MKRFLKIIALSLAGVFAAFALAGCGQDKGTITVGSKNFTESEILSEIYAQALEDKGYKVNRKFDISSSAIHTTLKNGDIDMYPGYTGTALLSVLKMPMQTDAKKVYQTVKKEYADKWNLTWLNYADATDSQGLAITTKAAKKYNIKTISDLQKNADKLRFASQGEFDERADGIPGLTKTYGPFNWKSSKIYDNSLKYQVLLSGKADVTPCYTTEGRLTSKKLTLLEDDKHFWPPYNVAPIVRASVLKKYPDIEKTLNSVSKQLDTKTLTKLNARVDIDKEDYQDVAKDFYNSIKDKVK